MWAAEEVLGREPERAVFRHVEDEQVVGVGDDDPAPADDGPSAPDVATDDRLAGPAVRSSPHG